MKNEIIISPHKMTLRDLFRAVHLLTDPVIAASIAWEDFTTKHPNNFCVDWKDWKFGGKRQYLYIYCLLRLFVLPNRKSTLYLAIHENIKNELNMQRGPYYFTMLDMIARLFHDCSLVEFVDMINVSIAYREKLNGPKEEKVDYSNMTEYMDDVVFA